ncbi:MAG: 3-hydroxyacyl-CoA dehydrogenase [Alphaproteobacteria bacterium]|jgi:3-hydroxyacyl-CoA dehydrogenase|nr:3-hydroxyacyl-CoA dehydrogenase [Alphaproteobacteria bacterium]MDP6516272.1 3-hydroxyacyl-CoA dehydrogenase [Alphaproteobacteria bacterium]
MADKIAIVGCGLVGRAWAIVFARAGHAVALHDPVAGALDNALALIEATLPELERNDLLRGSTAAEVREHLAAVGDLEAALAEAVHVQESAPENPEVKRALWAELDRLAPSAAVIASSTSAIPASAFTESLGHRGRCLVAHPINPPHLVPLVELVPAPWTDADVVARTRALMAAVGQAPITLNREIDGFVANRMQVALMQEAYRLVEEGICGVGDVDTAIAEGIGLRWSFIGPFEVGDLNAPDGIADYCRRFSDMFYEIARTQTEARRQSPETIAEFERQRRALLAADQLGERSRWRDRRLMELAVWKTKVARGDLE